MSRAARRLAASARRREAAIADRLPGSGRAPLSRAMLMLLLLAMLPLAVLALLQGMARIDRDARDVHRGLHDNLRIALVVEQNIVDAAARVLAMLAEQPAVIGGEQPACSRELARMRGYFPAYANFSVMDGDGRILCTAGGDVPEGGPVLDAHGWAQVRTATGPLVTRPLWDAPPGRNGPWVSLPIFDMHGDFAGAMTASVDASWLQRQLRERYADPNVMAMLVDGRGRPMLTADAALWPRLVVDGDRGAVHELRDTRDHRWMYVVAPILDDPDRRPQFYMAFMALRADLPGPDWWFIGAHVALPVLALLFASGAIWIGTQWGVLRWIGALRQLAAEYARANYRARDDIFATAPQEMRDLAASLYRMAHTIEQRDRAIRDALTRQKALARELNHRVKNNLQIVSSLLTMQARNLPETSRIALADARLRVGALALVHRLLYETDELSTISTERLIGELCGLVEQHHDVGNARVDCDIAAIPVDIDRAVPLTLWTVEALSGALRRAFDREHGTSIFLRLVRAGDDIHVEITDDAGVDPQDRRELALRRLLAGIGRQLGGRLEVAVDGALLCVALYFPLHRGDGVGEQFSIPAV